MAPRPESTVYCPSCGRPKQSRAQRNVKLVCSFCGTGFRAPEPSPVAADDAGDQAPAPSEEGTAAGPPAGAGAQADPVPGAVVVTHADPRVSTSGRPRQRGAGDVAEPEPEPQVDVEPEPVPPAPEIAREPVPVETLTPPGQAKAKAAGRRGGLAKYEGLRR